MATKTPEATVIRQYTSRSGRQAEVIEVLGEGYFLREGDNYYRQCWKCGGTGYLPGYEFSDNARCWHCGTRGWDHKFASFEKVVATAKRRIAARKKAAAKAKAMAEEAAARYAVECPAWREANTELVRFAESVTDPRDLTDYSISNMVKTLNEGSYLNESDTKRMYAFLAREAEKAERAAKSGFLGTVGERMEITVEIVKVIPVDDHYARYENATKPLYIMRDVATGNELVWFAPSWGQFSVGDEFVTEGDVVTVKATVKDHRVSDREANRGLKQTTVTRVKIA
jgi:hypothetical protein